jgi:PAB-dependent poly(A)-specific ribonuclease subunit 2
MPYYREQLLSAWPSHMIFEVGAPPPKLEPQLALRKEGWFEFAPNPGNVRRNQVVNTRTTERSAASLQAPKFLSEKARESANEAASTERRISDVADAIGATELSSLKAEVPVMYRNVEIKYSRFGVDDFDFGYGVQSCRT